MAPGSLTKQAERWVSPGAVEAGGRRPPRGRYLLRAHEELLDVRLEIIQAQRRLLLARCARVTAGRSTALPAGWATALDPADGPVTLRLLTARRR